MSNNDVCYSWEHINKILNAIQGLTKMSNYDWYGEEAIGGEWLNPLHQPEVKNPKETVPEPKNMMTTREQNSFEDILADIKYHYGEEYRIISEENTNRQMLYILVKAPTRGDQWSMMCEKMTAEPFIVWFSEFIDRYNKKLP